MLKEARQGSAAASRAAAQAGEQEAAQRRREAQRRLQPRTSADFALLHSELEAWRLAETARIKGAGLSPEECHRALAHLLHQVNKPTLGCLPRRRCLHQLLLLLPLLVQIPCTCTWPQSHIGSDPCSKEG